MWPVGCRTLRSAVVLLFLQLRSLQVKFTVRMQSPAVFKSIARCEIFDFASMNDLVRHSKKYAIIRKTELSVCSMTLWLAAVPAQLTLSAS